jgi:hypothetical protein
MNFSTTTICIAKATPYRVLNFTYEGDKLLTLFDIAPLGGLRWHSFITEAPDEEIILNLLPHLQLVDEVITLNPTVFNPDRVWLEKTVKDYIVHFVSEREDLISNYLKQQ